MGLGLTYSPSLMIITFYFERFRALASGISVSGFAVGILSGSLLTQAIIDVYGLGGAFLIIAAFAFNCSVFGMLYRPTPHEGQGRRGKKNLRSLRDTEKGERTENTATSLEKIGLLPSRYGGEVVYDCDNVEECEKRALVSNGDGDAVCDGDSINPSEKPMLVSNADTENGLGSDSAKQSAYTPISQEEQSDAYLEPGGLNEKFTSRTSLQTDPESNEPQGLLERCDLEPHGKSSNPISDMPEIKYSESQPQQRLSHLYDNASPKTQTHEDKEASFKKPSEAHVKTEVHISDAETCSPIKHNLLNSKLRDTVNRLLPLLRNLAFLSHCMNNLCAAINMSGVYLHLPEYSRTHGTSPRQAAALFVGVGIFSLVSRLASGLLLTSTRVNSLVLSVGLMSVCGAATSLFPLYSDTYVGQMAFASLFGLSTGGFFTLINVLTVELVEVTLLPAAYGLMIFIMGFGYVAGPPIAGMIVDSGGTYEHSFIFLGLAMFASAAFDLLAKVLHTRRNKQGKLGNKPVSLLAVSSVD